MEGAAAVVRMNSMTHSLAPPPPSTHRGARALPSAAQLNAHTASELYDTRCAVHGKLLEEYKELNEKQSQEAGHSAR
ncbi:unnamed protein product [Leuciscus chuanchicus]